MEYEKATYKAVTATKQAVFIFHSTYSLTQQQKVVHFKGQALRVLRQLQERIFTVLLETLMFSGLGFPSEKEEF